MKKWWLLGLCPLLTFAQSSMDSYRWYLSPQGQEVLISIDDLHDERLIATPAMDWGRAVVPSIKLKKDVVIAIIDGGLELEHPEIKNHIAYNEAECFEGTTIPPKDGEDKDGNGYKGDCAGWNFVENHNRASDLDGHGTHVTGVIRSAMAGVQGGFRFLPLNVFAPEEGTASPQGAQPLPVRLTKAFEYALSRQVDVIHLSVGWPKSFMTPELAAVVKKAIDAGVAVVSAAGNSSQRATIFPCQLDGVICVGALRPDGSVARFSNWGSQVDIFAPGEKILSTIPFTVAPLHISRKGYDYKNGTSQAAPFISAAMALLRGVYPDAPLSELYARLMLTADSVAEGKGLKGLFHLDRALAQAPRALVLPQLKGVHSVLREANGSFELQVSFENLWAATAQAVSAELRCEEASLSGAVARLGRLDAGKSQAVIFRGTVAANLRELNCSVAVGDQRVPLRLKVQHPMPRSLKEITVAQSEPLVMDTKLGPKSRFLTMNALKDQLPQPLYYLPGREIAVYREDQRLGLLPLMKDCTFLRLWQLDLDQDGQNEMMLESMCDKTHLQYQFLSLGLKEIYPAATLKPSLTILNYDEFELITTAGKPPVFRFTGPGFATPTDTPWDSDVSGRANHLYELRPVKDGEKWKLEPTVLEDPQQWVKSLGLRYLPDYQVYHYVKGRLLVRLGQKTAWVDVRTQEAQWANLDDLLLVGSHKQRVWGSEETVLQSMLTPFDYRGYVLGGVKLRFQQADRFDPFMDVLGTQRNAQGYLTVIRSFQRLIYLQFDPAGTLIKRTDSVVDRFDFLTAEDLIASVVNMPLAGQLSQLVDGTKLNTDYVDLVKGGVVKSLKVPEKCVTQQPVLLDGTLVLPLFCAQTREEFEMRFVEL